MGYAQLFEAGCAIQAEVIIWDEGKRVFEAADGLANIIHALCGFITVPEHGTEVDIPSR